MPRIRSIKPEFWSSEQVMACSRDARLLFIGMWNFCDDAGVCVNSAKTIKAQVVPGDEDITSENVQRWLDELSSKHLIRIYEAEGRSFVQITGWHHQKIDRPRPSKYPSPDVEASTNDRRGVATDLILSEGIRSEGSGGEPARTRVDGLLDENWKPAGDTVKAAKLLGLTEADLGKMQLRFGPHYRARGEKRANWDEQFLAWCADEAEKRGRTPPKAPTPPAPEGPIDARWVPIRNHLIASIGIDAVNSWFKNAEIVSMDETTLVLGAPTKFITKWWGDNYVPQVGEAVRSAYENITTVEFTLARRKAA